MNLEKLFENRKEVDRLYYFYIDKKLLKKIKKDDDLVRSHIEKAKHNLLFFDKNKDDENFSDWLAVTLYYALYHAVLALIVNKQYSSKNHTASLIFLIKNYTHLREDIKLLHELSIRKEDVEFYTELKEYRHKASYETNHSFEKDRITKYKFKVIAFIDKVELILEK